MATSPLSIYSPYVTPMPWVDFQEQPYVPGDPGPLASAGNTAYDRWLYHHNMALQNQTLPSYNSNYNSYLPQNPINGPPGTGVYTPPPSNYPVPEGYTPPEEPIYSSPAPVPTEPQLPFPEYPGYPTVPGVPTPTPVPTMPGATPTPSPSTPVVGPSGGSVQQTPAEAARLAARAHIQGLVAAGDQEGVIQYMSSQGIGVDEFNEMMSYNGSPITSGTPQNWLINASQTTGLSVPGLNYASPEELNSYITWQGTQNGITGQNIGAQWEEEGINPYTNPTITGNAQTALSTGNTQWQQPAQPQNPEPTQPEATSVGPSTYQQVAGSFVNPDTGEIVTYDSNGVHTGTGQIDPEWAQQHTAHARGGLVSMARKYGAGRGVNGLAQKYNIR